MTTQEQLDNLFTYHAPTPGLPEVYQEIRASGKSLTQVIMTNTPPGDDQDKAIDRVREAVMWANAALATAPVEHQASIVEAARERNSS